MKLKVYAKVNLALYVTAKGVMHSLDGVMASVGIYDEIEVVESTHTQVYMDGVQVGETNSAYKAIRAFERRYHPVSVRVDISKGIPMQAGLGGSSADSAGVLYALGKIYDKPVDVLALECGSDVPFMLVGGVARVGGIGESVSTIPLSDYPSILIVKGEGGVSTPLAYATYDQMNIPISNHTLEAIETISRGVYDSEYLTNDLQTPAIRLNPDIARIQSTLSECGLKAVMSGSGSAVWAMGDNLVEVSRALEDKYPYVKLTDIVQRGIVEL